MEKTNRSLTTTMKNLIEHHNYDRGEDSFPASGGLSESRQPNTHRVMKNMAINLVVAMVVFFGSFVAGNKFFFTIVRVNGTSMAPTLADGDLYILNKLTYKLRDPRVGEVVVFRDPDDSLLSIKRVVGIPGDTLMIRDGVVYRNNEPITEPYLEQNTKTFLFEESRNGMVTLQDKEFFLLGDNRENSLDSRFYGGVSKTSILGVINKS